MLPGMVFVMLTNPEVIAAAMTGDTAQVEQALLGLGSSDALMVCMLFANLAMIGIVMLFCKVVQKRKMNTLGFVKKNMGREYLKGLGFGFLLFSAAVLLCVVTGSLKLKGISPDFAPGMFLLFVLGFLIQGMAEEVLCRGYFLVSFGRRHSMWAAALANALLFAMLHLGSDIVWHLRFGLFHKEREYLGDRGFSFHLESGAGQFLRNPGERHRDNVFCACQQSGGREKPDKRRFLWPGGRPGGHGCPAGRNGVSAVEAPCPRAAEGDGAVSGQKLYLWSCKRTETLLVIRL